MALILLMGIPGAGKSTLASALRSRLEAMTMLPPSCAGADDNAIGMETPLQYDHPTMTTHATVAERRRAAVKVVVYSFDAALRELDPTLTTNTARTNRVEWQRRVADALARQCAGDDGCDADDGDRLRETPSPPTLPIAILDDVFALRSMRRPFRRLARRRRLVYVRVRVRCTLAEALRRNAERRRQTDADFAASSSSVLLADADIVRIYERFESDDDDDDDVAAEEAEEEREVIRRGGCRIDHYASIGAADSHSNDGGAVEVVAGEGKEVATTMPTNQYVRDDDGGEEATPTNECRCSASRSTPQTSANVEALAERIRRCCLAASSVFPSSTSSVVPAADRRRRCHHADNADDASQHAAAGGECRRRHLHQLDRALRKAIGAIMRRDGGLVDSGDGGRQLNAARRRILHNAKQRRRQRERAQACVAEALAADAEDDAEASASFERLLLATAAAMTIDADGKQECDADDP